MTTRRTVLTTIVSLAGGLAAGAMSLPILGSTWARVPAVTLTLAIATSMIDSPRRAVRLVPGWLVFFACLAYMTSRPFDAAGGTVLAAGAVVLLAGARYALRRS